MRKALTKTLKHKYEANEAEFFFSDSIRHFRVNICVRNQQMHQLFIQFINYVW
jgi:hypothetical protein